MDLEAFEVQFRQKIMKVTELSADAAHDFLHFERVVATAKRLAKEEGGNLQVVVPAAWLHDVVIIKKDDPRRSQASRLSAKAAAEYLQQIHYDLSLVDEIAHAIEAHSFSAAIPCQTLEAKIIQDADRLDGLGAIGIARCFATAGLLGSPFYSAMDPFCKERQPNDRLYTVDHFYQKLFRTAETLQTHAGQEEGKRRAATMIHFLSSLQQELSNGL